MRKTKKKCDSMFSFGRSLVLKPDVACTDDPVKVDKKLRKKEETELNKPKPEIVKPTSNVARAIPSFGTRLELKTPLSPYLQYGQARIRYTPPLYTPPKTKKVVKIMKDDRKKYVEDLNFCKWDPLNMPKPPTKSNVTLEITIPSPEQSEAVVVPRKPSPTLSEVVPNIPNQESLELKKPKSGVFINVKDVRAEETLINDYDSFDLVFQRQPRPGFETETRVLGTINEEDMLIPPRKRRGKMPEPRRPSKSPRPDQSGLSPIEEEDPENLTKIFRKKVSQMSKATSYKSKDFREEGEEEGEEEPEDEEEVEIESLGPPVGQMTQKFRRDSEMDKYQPTPRKVKRGTLESHSFTRLCQPTLKEFYFGTRIGTMHQGDAHFPDISRNKQGICMPVAAYCYALLKHPSRWQECDIDEILECGNALYMECVSRLHKHCKSRQLNPHDLGKYCYLFDKKIRFKVSDPEVTGVIRSDQKNVYNLTKGLHIFFSRNQACIFQTQGTNICIWKDRYFYLFDAQPRTKDLYPETFGKAIMANFYDVDSVRSVLLDRCFFGNWPFVLFAIEAYHITDKHEPEVRESIAELDDRSNFNIMNESKAVVLGSFDLGDKCFDFTRNKQALPMAAMCLVYSKITPPSAWHKSIVDKIMLVGNQLYIESIGNNPPAELKLDQLPAEFSVGPYFVEIYVKPSVFGDFLCRKGRCLFEQCLDQFFAKYQNAIVDIGTFTMAIWKQRGVYFCFDPYPRNIEGFICRNGTACVSMHSTLDSLTTMILKNFQEKETIFYLHALIVLKIHRDQAQACVFPPNVTMNCIDAEDLKKYTMRKSRKTAVKKTVVVGADANAVIHPPPFPLCDDSIIEIGSHIGSLGMDIVPTFPHTSHIKPRIGDDDVVADLDSPSLSDTQIEPPVPEEEFDGEPRVDIDSYQLTMEEMEEMKGMGEGEGDMGWDALWAIGKIPGQGGDDFYFGANAFTSIGSESLVVQTASAMVGAELSEFRMTAEILHPTNLAKTLGRKRRVYMKTERGSIVLGYEPELEVTQSEELRKPSNFVELPDNSQIVRGKSNMATTSEDLEFLAPFVCIMATAVAKKFALISWNPEVVEYVLNCGDQLYKASKVRYDQVSRLDIPRVSLGATDFHIVVEYIFDTYLKDNILELALDRILFVRSDCGIFVTPTYACSVFYRHHLYYLYDGFGNNEVGMSEGDVDKGCACLIRFRDLKSMVQRIIYNKTKREGGEVVEYSRFVLSRCIVTRIKPLPGKMKKPPVETGEDDEWMDVGEDQGHSDEAQAEPEEEKIEPPPIKVEVGYKLKNRVQTLRGSKALEGRGIGDTQIKEDHFACICACLMLIEVPIEKWDTLKVNQVIDQGAHIFAHADDLSATEKRIIKNILIQKHFFDVIVKQINLPMYSQNRTMSTGIDTLFYKKYCYFLIQMIGACNVLYKAEDATYHLFDPYAFDERGRPVKGKGKGGWIKYRSLAKVKSRLRYEANKTGGRWTFYTFEVTSIKKAPKRIVISHEIHQYHLEKHPKKETIDKPFFEEVFWLNVDPIPWSRMRYLTACGEPRGSRDNMWNNWDIEYPGDLFALIGNIHQSSRNFSSESRGRQTLNNLVTAIAMIEIYSLGAWNSAVIDSVLVNGDNYCRECIKDIVDSDYELSVDDLKPECSIFPYNFKLELHNVVQGTMFLLRSKSYNLYKSLRYFFDDAESRSGIICVVKNNGKRQVAFGKVKEAEYFMFDCESVGAPMFPDGKAVAYILRMTTLNRLLHVLTLTLRGGDFFIFEVVASDFTPIE